jgi:hypothetical protein
MIRCHRIARQLLVTGMIACGGGSDGSTGPGTPPPPPPRPHYRVPGAGAHNFWMDEPRQVLSAAFYNGGVVAFWRPTPGFMGMV